MSDEVEDLEVPEEEDFQQVDDEDLAYAEVLDSEGTSAAASPVNALRRLRRPSDDQALQSDNEGVYGHRSPSKLTDGLGDWGKEFSVKEIADSALSGVLSQLEVPGPSDLPRDKCLNEHSLGESRGFPVTGVNEDSYHMVTKAAQQLEALAAADKDTGSSALTTGHREEQDRWAAGVFNRLANETGSEWGKPGWRSRTKPLSMSAIAQAFGLSTVSEGDSSSPSGGAHRGTSSVRTPLSSVDVSSKPRSSWTPPSPPAPSSNCSHWPGQGGSAPSCGNPARPEDGSLTVPACGLRYSPTNSASSRMAALARHSRAKVPGLDMSKAHMNYDDDEDSETGSRVADLYQGPPEGVPQLNMSAIFGRADGTCTFGAPGKGGLDVNVPLAHSSMERPPSRQAQSTGAVVNRNQLGDFWVGQVERRQTLPEDDCVGNWDGADTSGERLRKRAASCAEFSSKYRESSMPAAALHRSPSSGASRQGPPSTTAAAGAVIAGQQQQPGKVLNKSFDTLSFAGLMDPMGAVIKKNPRQKSEKVEGEPGLRVRLPPVRAKEAQAAAPGLRVEVHSHYHYHHHVFVAGDKVVREVRAN
eukprot:TRINITY_DN69461_c0_g1_i1.p1 TRINITY_DN69461_c0_g1~~TRINITY_DN69461_c0_g1_i1.p1  ORF type:complete len:585 (-),score=102.55 TRINITY_DN69461_c0_g1_i1:100-1854(-)